MKQLTRLLGFKLVIIIFGVMIAVTVLYTIMLTQWHSQQFVDNAIQSTVMLSDVVKRSLHYSMLKNHRDDITQIIRTVGNEPGLEGIRVYNKAGAIMFSSDSSEVGKTARVDDVACIMCHANGHPVRSPHPEDLTRVFASPKGYRIAGTITPIANHESCANAGCHVHPKEQTILGVLDVMVSLESVDASLIELSSTQIAGGVFIVLTVTAMTGLFIWITVNIPVRRLLVGTEEIRKGNLLHRIPVNTSDELGMLAGSFNRMTEELQRAHSELTDWAQKLEERVAEKTEELKRAQAHMISMEKMVSLGTLAATVAHELNNPLEGVLTYTKLLQRKTERADIPEEAKAETGKTLSIIAEETARCGNIVKNLLLFSRQEMGEFADADLRAVIDRSVQLIEHHLQMHNVTLDLQVGEKPCILRCDPNQLEQAFLAMMINAVEAMPDGGKLSIRIDTSPEKHTVTIRDTGVGIRAEDMQHIFEPFYTTKHNEKGTGLGLAVAYGIIQRHDGEITVTSTPSAGATFVVILPRKNSIVPGEQKGIQS